MIEYLSSPQIWASFLTLSALEIVLGIDNVIFISIVAAKLPKAKQFKARLIGLTGALVMRVIFLLSVVWLTRATAPLFAAFGQDFSTRDVILFLGGVFLLYKATIEIHDMTEGSGGQERNVRVTSFVAAVTQIMLLDLVFSIDSVLTAIGMTNEIPIMIAAIFVAIIIMLVASEALGRFIEEHPTTKMLALAFLLLVGVALIADAFGVHLPREYLYSAIAFSAFVEVLNVTVLKRHVKSSAEPSKTDGPDGNAPRCPHCGAPMPRPQEGSKAARASSQSNKSAAEWI